MPPKRSDKSTPKRNDDDRRKRPGFTPPCPNRALMVFPFDFHRGELSVKGIGEGSRYSQKYQPTTSLSRGDQI